MATSPYVVPYGGPHRSGISPTIAVVIVLIIIIIVYGYSQGWFTVPVSPPSQPPSQPSPSPSQPSPTPQPQPTPVLPPSKPKPVNPGEEGCDAASGCINMRAANNAGGGPYQRDIQCAGDTDYSNTLTGDPGRYLFMKGYNNATFAKYTDQRSAIKAYCATRAPPVGTVDCNSSNNCVDLKAVNIAGYGDFQRAVKCTNDADYTNTIMGGPGNYKFTKGYDTATFGTYPTLQGAVAAYCADPTRGGSYDR